MKVVQMTNKNSTPQADVEGESNSARFQRIMGFVEDELYGTLDYLNDQILKVDLQSADIEGFNKFVFEAKKMLVEQKISTLSRLSTMAIDRLKLNIGDDSEIKDITSLFNK